MIYQIIQDSDMFITDIATLSTKKDDVVYIEVKIPTTIDLYYYIGMVNLWRDVYKRVGCPIRLYGYVHSERIEKYIQRVLIDEGGITFIPLREGEKICLPT